ncbi:class I SAM-dependent RNA methyltransferase [Nocardioides sp. HDW12B]|uniref:class I SAM-dependent RNA methyltransferase n=1 Tax=Nocardioides sp. HDW12B TaxID=2714939 RepID=UPI001409B719|nr:TRAM domain-containing protein [Nocardioides sp. HDW12B]QIK66746.1 class I SAM-dependent RNA methyltransferase [Nocardioides sp. HDW12B]
MSRDQGRGGRAGRARGRHTRPKAPRGRSLVGERFTVEVDRFGHGGFGVARLGDDAGELAGTVVFVRHSLPGERVVVALTEGEVGSRFLRGDAVEVLTASPDRVTPPCPLAGPGPDRCGGCDLQHVDLAAQRRLKGEVVAEQLRRIAHLEREVVVEALPSDLPSDVAGEGAGLHWRTRMRYHRLPDGRLGLRASRSDRVVPVPDCPVEAPEAVVVVEGEQPERAEVTEMVRGHSFDVATDGFWQVHRDAPEALLTAVTSYAAVRPGERVLDLYAGVGLFTVFLADAAGPQGRVDGVEGDARAVAHGRENVAAYPWAHLHAGSVAQVLAGPEVSGRCDVVVLDPPREGAKRAVVEQVVGRTPRAVVLVGCDPAAFARDVSLFAESGYELEQVRAFDLFPMTHHVETVGLLVPGA